MFYNIIRKLLTLITIFEILHFDICIIFKVEIMDNNDLRIPGNSKVEVKVLVIIIYGLQVRLKYNVKHENLDVVSPATCLSFERKIA